MERNDALSPFSVDSIPAQAADPTRRDFLRKYKTNVMKWLAIAQTTIGLLMLILGILTISIPNVCSRPLCIIGYGMWFGTLYSTTGVVGMCSVKFHPHRKLVLSNMGLNIVLSSLSFVPFTLALDDVAVVTIARRWKLDRNTDLNASLAVLGLVIIFTIFQIIICVVSASICCKALCQCCNESRKLPNYAFFDGKTQKFVFVSRVVQGICLQNNEGTCK